jgi:hypothetical protein
VWIYVEIIEAVSKMYAERRILLWRNGSIRCLQNSLGKLWRDMETAMCFDSGEEAPVKRGKRRKLKRVQSFPHVFDCGSFFIRL